jgi:hypothetical protein
LSTKRLHSKARGGGRPEPCFIPPLLQCCVAWLHAVRMDLPPVVRCRSEQDVSRLKHCVSGGALCPGPLVLPALPRVSYSQVVLTVEVCHEAVGEPRAKCSTGKIVLIVLQQAKGSTETLILFLLYVVQLAALSNWWPLMPIICSCCCCPQPMTLSSLVTWVVTMPWQGSKQARQANETLRVVALQLGSRRCCPPNANNQKPEVGAGQSPVLSPPCFSVRVAWPHAVRMDLPPVVRCRSE